MVRHGNSRWMASSTACHRTTFWPQLTDVGFSRLSVNLQNQDWSVLTRWKPRLRVRTLESVRCICIECEQTSPLSPELFAESQLGGGWLLWKQKRQCTPGCSTIPCTNTVTSVQTMKIFKSSHVWCHNYVVEILVTFCPITRRFVALFIGVKCFSQLGKCLADVQTMKHSHPNTLSD